MKNNNLYDEELNQYTDQETEDIQPAQEEAQPKIAEPTTNAQQPLDMATEYSNFKASQNAQPTQSAPAVEPTQATPQYSSQWDAELDSIMGQIMNRKPFKYDINGDAMYHQYEDKFTRQADAAMQNAMGQAAALTGGYGSSYAQTAGQQAYAKQMQGLYDIMPELEAQAYAQYAAEGDDLNQRYAMIANREAQDYARFLDERAQENYENEMAYQKERDAVSDSQWQQSFEYQQGRDAVADEQWQDAFNYQQTQDAQDQANWEESFKYQQSQDEQDQANWQAQFDTQNSQWQQAFDREGEQWEKLYGEGGLYNKTEPTEVVYNGGGTLQGQNVPMQLQNIPGLTTTDTTWFDENGNFKKAEFQGETPDGKMSYRINGKTVTYDKGINPYTETYNDDCKNGTFSNGYQPNNVNGSKLSKTGEQEYVNGVLQNIWEDEKGNRWIWDGTQNKYIDV